LTFSELFSEFSTDFGVVASFFSSHTIFMALIALAMLFATGWIMEHKVNIK